MTNEALHFSFVLRDQAAVQQMWATLRPHFGPAIRAGLPLRVEVSQGEPDRRDGTAAHYWGHILKDIAEQALVSGRHHDAKTWHEYLAGKFLPVVEIVTPDGELVRRRSSIARGQISEKKMRAYLQEVEAYAGAELGVRFREYDSSKFHNY
jgi:hypothetical protein